MFTYAAQYEEGSAPALALKATMERTEKRFKNYGDAGLLCGTDGLPHLISDPGLALRYGHTGETLVRCSTRLHETHVHWHLCRCDCVILLRKNNGVMRIRMRYMQPQSSRGLHE